MGPRLLLRISAVLMFIHALFHTLGHLKWKTLSSPSYDEVVKQMTVPKFPFMGAVHSIGDYFDGYGYFITLAVVLIGCLLWALSDIAVQYPLVGLKLLIPITILIILLFLDTLIFFFPLASIYCGLCSVTCTMAIVKLNKAHIAEVKGAIK
jgi:hypothetical protein